MYNHQCFVNVFVWFENKIIKKKLSTMSASDHWLHVPTGALQRLGIDCAVVQGDLSLRLCTSSCKICCFPAHIYDCTCILAWLEYRIYPRCTDNFSYSTYPKTKSSQVSTYSCLKTAWFMVNNANPDHTSRFLASDLVCSVCSGLLIWPIRVKTILRIN